MCTQILNREGETVAYTVDPETVITPPFKKWLMMKVQTLIERLRGLGLINGSLVSLV